MNGNQNQYRFPKQTLEQLLLQAPNYAPEVGERLGWFLHYSVTGSIGETCRHFRIARTTFYRWASRFDPANLHSLEDAPNLLTSQRVAVAPIAPAPTPVEPNPVKQAVRPSRLLLVSVILNALFIGGLLATAIWESGFSVNADLTGHGAATQTQPTNCPVTEPSALDADE